MMLDNKSQEFLGFSPQWIPFVGVCEDNNDPMQLGRVRVRIFGIHTEDKQMIPTLALPWSIVATPTTSASNSGVGETPQILPGTWVVGYLLDGEKAQIPMVTHTLPGQHRSNPEGHGGGPPDAAGNNTSQLSNERGDGTVAKLDNPEIISDSNGSTGFYTARDKNQKIGKYYPRDLAEFKVSRRAPQTFESPPGFRFNKATAYAFDLLCKEMGQRLQITSAWRGNATNSRVGGSWRHPTGRAIDVDLSGWSKQKRIKFFQKAAQLGFIGFGTYETFAHIDTAGAAVWYHSGSLGKNELVSALRKVGWHPGIKAFALNKTAVEATKNNSTTSSSGNTMPAILGGLRQESTNQNNNFPGFNDPTQTFPINKNHAGISSLPLMARGGTDGVMSREYSIDAGRITGFQLADGTSIGEPPATPTGTYPYTKTIADVFGHNIILDSSPQAEKIQLYSPTGSYVEIDSKGTIVTKASGDKTDIIARNYNVGMVGDYNLSVTADHNSKTGGDYKHLTEGTMNITIRNDNTITVHGDYQLRVGDDVRIKARTIYIEADNIHLLAKENLNLRGEKDINLHAGKNIKMNANGGDLDMKSNGKMRAQSGGTTSITSGGNMYADAPQIRLAEKGEEPTAALKANDTDIPEAKLERAKVKTKPNFPPNEIEPIRSVDRTARRGGGGGSGGHNRNASGDKNYMGGSSNHSSYSGTQSTNRTSNEQPGANAQRAFNLLKSLGWSDASAAGAVGNFMEESTPNLNTTAYNSKEGAFGIAQWRNERRQALLNYAAATGQDYRSLDTQVRFFDLEARGQARRYGSTETRDIYGQTQNMSPSEAAAHIDKYYERSDGKARQDRMEQANTVYDKYSGNKDSSGGGDSDENPKSPEKQGTPPNTTKSNKDEDKKKEEDKYAIEMTSAIGIKNYVNSCQARMENDKLKVKEEPKDETLAAVKKVATKTLFPEELIYLIASWEGDGKKIDISESKAEEIVNKIYALLPKLTEKLERYPTRGEVYIAYYAEQGDDAVEFIKNALDKKKRDDEAKKGKEEDKKKKEGPNANNKRTNIELYNHLNYRIVSYNTAFSPNPVPPKLAKEMEDTLKSLDTFRAGQSEPTP